MLVYVVNSIVNTIGLTDFHQMYECYINAIRTSFYIICFCWNGEKI